MVKRLILLRHAKSSWNSPSLSDFDRPLNNRGKEDAPAMGLRLKKRGLRPELIVSSPARRARKTARLVARQVGYPKEDILKDGRIYEGDLLELMEIVMQLDDKHGHVMMIGHNPGFTDLANYLTGGRIPNVPTCGIVCLDFEIEKWEEVKRGTAHLVFFDFPKNTI